MSKSKKHILLYSLTGMVILLIVSFTSTRNEERQIENIDIEISEAEGLLFTDDEEVLDLMTEKSADYVIGVQVEELDPKILEERVELNPFVKDAQVFRDLKGNLQVLVEQSKPIARYFVDGKNDKYIDGDGRVLPIHSKYTARVPIVESELEWMWDQNLTETKYGKQVLALIHFISEDAFWNAQIAQIILKKDGEVDLLPQVTKQIVHFGYPEHFEVKFSKLMTFYKEILPIKGWNSYTAVDLKYENQIICK
ncbi:MAG: cell division protein FtsQ [Bacteroidota bacterium]